jgi:predicted histidine transporter YuiF (NhaC family)
MGTAAAMMQSLAAALRDFAAMLREWRNPAGMVAIVCGIIIPDGMTSAIKTVDVVRSIHLPCAARLTKIYCEHHR